MICPCFPPFYDPIFIASDDLGAETSKDLLSENIQPTTIGRYVCKCSRPHLNFHFPSERDDSSTWPPLLRFARSAWQQSMQWHPTERPQGCHKRYDRRHRRWMRRACHYNSTRRRRRRRQPTTTTTTTTTTPGPPTPAPTARTKKRCFKRYHKKYKKYVTKCVYW